MSKEEESNKNWLQRNPQYLAIIIVFALLALLALFIQLNPSDTTAPEVDTSAPQGGVVIEQFVGRRGDKYYANTFKFEIPQQLKQIRLLQLSDFEEQVTFAFNNGRGTILSTPLSGTESISSLKNSYSGTRQEIKLAGNKGYLFKGKNGQTRIWNIIGLADQEKFSIQLSQYGQNDDIQQVAKTIIDSLQARG